MILSVHPKQASTLLIAQKNKLLFQNRFVIANHMVKEIYEKWLETAPMSLGIKIYYPIHLAIIYTQELVDSQQKSDYENHYV